MARGRRPRRTTNRCLLLAVGALIAINAQPTVAAELSLRDRIDFCDREFVTALDRLICFEQVVQTVAATRPAVAAGVVLAEFSGEGSGPLQAFRAGGPWILEWDAPDGHFHVRELDRQGQPVRNYAGQALRGAGRSPEYAPRHLQLSHLR